MEHAGRSEREKPLRQLNYATLQLIEANQRWPLINNSKRCPAPIIIQTASLFSWVELINIPARRIVTDWRFPKREAIRWKQGPNDNPS